MDWSTYAIKLGYTEIGRRCKESGSLETDRDFYFLTLQELHDVFDVAIQGSDDEPGEGSCEFKKAA